MTILTNLFLTYIFFMIFFPDIKFLTLSIFKHSLNIFSSLWSGSASSNALVSAIKGTCKGGKSCGKGSSKGHAAQQANPKGGGKATLKGDGKWKREQGPPPGTPAGKSGRPEHCWLCKEWGHPQSLC